MLADVEESNRISEVQTIKLDLNGKTITSLTNYGFINDGVFIIVDYNENSVGRVISGISGIKNTGILQIGENEEELIVSKKNQ